jgi:D-alanine-D-alanine ligase
MIKKLKVGVIFGGRSSEHEVSLASATSVIKALDKEKYDVVMIGISKEGKWLSSGKTLQLLKENQTGNFIYNEKVLLPDPQQKGLVEIKNRTFTSSEQIDVIIPIMHGLYGEDGTIQGLFELANIPYVGAGVLASSVGMDKIIQKNLFIQAELPVSDFLWFHYDNYLKDSLNWIEKIENKLKYPCFIKPANSGSSVGINKAHDRKELIEFIKEAAQYDVKILVEEGVPNVREIECSVLGNENPIASVLGEIIPSNEFYDYDSKYVDGKSECIIPAKLPEDITQKIRKYAIEAFNCIDCSGMARADFFVSSKTNDIFINEINTIPGFTSISMYPKLWEATGIKYSELLDKLIELAIEKFEKKANLKTSYQPKAKWYKNGEF